MSLCFHTSTSTPLQLPLELQASTPLRLQRMRISRAPYLFASTHTPALRLQHSYLHVYTRPELHTPMLPSRHACIAPPDLQTSITPYLHRYTCSAPPDLDASAYPRLQRASRAPYFYSSPSARLQRASRAPYLHTSMPPRLHAYSATPELRAAIPPLLHACSTSPALHTSIPPRLHTCSTPPELQSSIPTCLHIYTPTAGLETSIPLKSIAPPDGHTSMPPVPRFAALLQTSTASELRNSIPPRRYTS